MLTRALNPRDCRSIALLTGSQTPLISLINSASVWARKVATRHYPPRRANSCQQLINRGWGVDYGLGRLPAPGSSKADDEKFAIANG